MFWGVGGFSLSRSGRHKLYIAVFLSRACCIVNIQSQFCSVPEFFVSPHFSKASQIFLIWSSIGHIQQQQNRSSEGASRRRVSKIRVHNRNRISIGPSVLRCVYVCTVACIGQIIQRRNDGEGNKRTSWK